MIEKMKLANLFTPMVNEEYIHMMVKPISEDDILQILRGW